MFLDFLTSFIFIEIFWIFGIISIFAVVSSIAMRAVADAIAFLVAPLNVEREIIVRWIGAHGRSAVRRNWGAVNRLLHT